MCMKMAGVSSLLLWAKLTYWRNQNNNINPQNQFLLYFNIKAETSNLDLSSFLLKTFLLFSWPLLDRCHRCHIIYSLRNTTKTASRLPAPPSMTVMTGFCHIKGPDDAHSSHNFWTTTAIEPFPTPQQSKDHNRTPLRNQHQ